MAELNLILLGPPGSGKGTQGERLQEDLEYPYYATGDILRAAVKEGTEVGKAAKEYMDRGDLVPDEVIIGIIAERLESGEADWNFLGVADVSYGRFTASNVEIQISPNIEAQSIDFEVFWDWKTAGRVGVWVTGKFFLAADGIDRMNIGTSFGALIDSIAAEAIQGVVPFPVHAVTNIQTGWVYA